MDKNIKYIIEKIQKFNPIEYNIKFIMFVI